MWILLIMLVAPMYGQGTKEDFFKYWFKGSRVLEEYNKEKINFLDMSEMKSTATFSYFVEIAEGWYERTTNKKQMQKLKKLYIKYLSDNLLIAI